MNLVVVGNDAALAECKARFGEAHNYTHAVTSVSDVKQLQEADVVFDFFELGNETDHLIFWL